MLPLNILFENKILNTIDTQSYYSLKKHPLIIFAETYEADLTS